MFNQKLVPFNSLIFGFFVNLKNQNKVGKTLVLKLIFYSIVACTLDFCVGYTIFYQLKKMKTIIVFIIIFIVVLVVMKQIELKKKSEKGLQKIIDFGGDMIKAEASNLTLKEQEIYSDWSSEIKKEYDKIEVSENGWNQKGYDHLFNQTYPKVDAFIMNKYSLTKTDFKRIIDVGDVIFAKEISKKEMEILKRVDEIKKGDFKSKIQVAKEFGITFYEVSQAIKKSTINLTINLFK